MSLINVTRKERNGKPSVSDDLITTDKIAYPIREIGGEAYISVIESPLTGRGSENIVISNYLVDEDLDTVCNSTASLFKATVVTRDGRTPIAGYLILGFVADKIMGPIMTSGTGASFYYHEDNATYPSLFVVEETPAEIIAQTGTGGAASNIYTADGTLDTDRTVDGGNTAALFIQNLKDFQLNSDDKARVIGVNEAALRATSGQVLVESDYANGIFTKIDGVKKYKALLTQTGTSAPTAVVLENSLSGTPTFSYNGVGNYSLTLAGEFVSNKTFVLFGVGDQVQSISTGIVMSSVAAQPNNVAIFTFDAADVPTDEILYSTAILIEVYP